MDTMSGYSYATSHPAYTENKAVNKRTQCENVLAFVRKGCDNLLQISQLSKIPQAIVSARIGDLIEEEKVKYNGHVVYENRLRKKIILIVPVSQIKQANLF